jgi:hypothetical protein
MFVDTIKVIILFQIFWAALNCFFIDLTSFCTKLNGCFGMQNQIVPMSLSIALAPLELLVWTTSLRLAQENLECSFFWAVFWVSFLQKK